LAKRPNHKYSLRQAARLFSHSTVHPLQLHDQKQHMSAAWELVTTLSR